MGQHAADWLEGKSIPQAMDILPSALTSENLAQYEADLADPASVYTDPARRDAYLKMYGNICYDTRDQYVNFPWSSEAKNSRSYAMDRGRSVLAMRWDRPVDEGAP